MINTIVARSKCSKRGFRYDAEWLLKCVALRIKSPKAYQHLVNEKLLPLPHENTIKRIISGIPLEFGFNGSAFFAIQQKLKNLDRSMRLGSLGWDEMAIAKANSLLKTFSK